MLPVPLNSSKIDVIHAAAGSIQRGGDDGERAALFHVARGAAKKRRGRCKALASIPPESTLPEGGVDGVVGASEAVMERANTTTSRLVLNKTLGFFQKPFRRPGCGAAALVKRRADHFALDGALHVPSLLPGARQ